ncbi:hypothetical protein [Paraconexibacter algicola]|uniref:Uncharacterized protein n=1 Tax=Paraconexibacter algicola TaxID=2133960 RepID=A0A2T4UM18_9ACTN|nr:hypothetical protein [Paraconexibacter algicola]PTL60254.1 hypothetical protein C7Y72_11700 [Paraconexibacter algicola]
MRERDEIVIRSFRVVFQLDRRLHRIDRWRLPLPYGLPLRSLGYAAGALLLVLVVGQLPVLGTVVGALPAPVRLALIPGAAAYALTSIQVDGRPAHEAFIALVVWRIRPRVVTAWKRGTRPGQQARLLDVRVAPDASGPRLRRGRVRGPATAVVRVAATADERGRRLTLRGEEGAALEEGFEIIFDQSRRLVIR